MCEAGFYVIGVMELRSHPVVFGISRSQKGIEGSLKKKWMLGGAFQVMLSSGTEKSNLGSP